MHSSVIVSLCLGDFLKLTLSFNPFKHAGIGDIFNGKFYQGYGGEKEPNYKRSYPSKRHFQTFALKSKRCCKTKVVQVLDLAHTTGTPKSKMRKEKKTKGKMVKTCKVLKDTKLGQNT